MVDDSDGEVTDGVDLDMVDAGASEDVAAPGAKMKVMRISVI